MNNSELNVQEFSLTESIQIEGGIAWGWYVAALGLGVCTGIGIRMATC